MDVIRNYFEAVTCNVHFFDGLQKDTDIRIQGTDFCLRVRQYVRGKCVNGAGIHGFRLMVSISIPPRVQVSVFQA